MTFLYGFIVGALAVVFAIVAWIYTVEDEKDD